MQPTFDAAGSVQDLQYFGEFGGVNPSIEDASTYTFLKADKMEEIFEKEISGCYLYSRHWNPTNRYLSDALAALEGTESAQVTASGMGAISCALMQLCESGSEIVASRMIYGGTYAFMKNFLPKFHIRTRFVDITNLAAVEAAITPQTRVLFCESVSNPMLEVSDIAALAQLAHKYRLKLVVDNTFTPLLITPAKLGADIVIHSLTKFINGTSDTVGGVICASKAFIDSLSDVNSGASMLLGPVMDSLRAASVLKNMRSLHVRMQKHSENATFLAQHLPALGIRTIYPGLPDHPQHNLYKHIVNPVFGYGGMIVLDLETKERAFKFMELMQEAKVGYLAVSLGFYKTLFSSPGSSTSSEIPEDERLRMGLTPGLVRMSVGLDHNIAATFARIKACYQLLDTVLV